MNKYYFNKISLGLFILSFSFILNWCDLFIEVAGNFEGIFADDNAREEEVIEPLPEQSPEPELEDNVDLERMSEAKFISQMIWDLLNAENIQVTQIEDERLNEELIEYYYDGNRNIYSSVIDDRVQNYVYDLEHGHVRFGNPLAEHFNRRDRYAEGDLTYDERLAAAYDELDGRFTERSYELDFEVTTSSVLLPGPSSNQIENAEIYGNVVRGELRQDYIEMSNQFKIYLSELEPEDNLLVKVEANPSARTVTFSEHFEIKNPEESQTRREIHLGLKRTQYIITELEPDFPEVEDIEVISDTDALLLIREYDLPDIYKNK